MDNYQVAIIKPNSITVDAKKMGESFTREFIKNEISSHVIFHSVDTKDMMNLVYDTIKMTDKLIGNTSICYEDDQYIYQLCHLSLKDNQKKEVDENANGVSSYLVQGRFIVYGSSVLIRSKISDKGTCVTDTLDIDMIVDIIYKKLIHKAVKLSVDGVISDYTFYNDPLENCSNDIITNSKYVEVHLLKFNLLMFLRLTFDDQPENSDLDRVNKKATKLIGHSRVHGDVYIASKSTEHEYIDLDTDLLNKMLKLSGDSMTSRNLTEEEKEEGELVDGLPKVINRHTIIKSRYSNYNYLCPCGECKDINLNQEEVPIQDCICTGCYRLKYRTTECQKRHWSSHKKECFYGKDSLNLLLSKKLEQPSKKE